MTDGADKFGSRGGQSGRGGHAFDPFSGRTQTFPESQAASENVAQERQSFLAALSDEWKWEPSPASGTVTPASGQSSSLSSSLSSNDAADDQAAGAELFDLSDASVALPDAADEAAESAGDG